MDQYGCFRNSEDDWDKLAEELKNFGAVSFCYCGDDYTALIITITGPLRPLGTMAWGGNINQLFSVGLRRKGFGYFDLLSNDPVKIYDLDELEICHGDKKVLTELLEQIRIRLRGHGHA